MGFVKRFTRNLVGRDFTVADVHGCFSVLRNFLAFVNFDYAVDRLFLVGDLVDRGPECMEVLWWLEQPWCHAIRGNHEQMAIFAYFDPDQIDFMKYLKNGGAWFLVLNENQQQQYASGFDALPYAFEVETSYGQVGIIHAESPRPWPALIAVLEGTRRITNPRKVQLLHDCIWGRDKFKSKDPKIRNASCDGIDRLFVGHTVVPEPLRLGNVTYMDTGAVFGHTLTGYDLAHPDTVISVPSDYAWIKPGKPPRPEGL
jgi:serine/threonine protein phosphatase 1